jgi:uncharacterized protein with PIN domain
MKFIADVMLGRLAKRMRLYGFDVLYDRNSNDNDIIRLSLGQNRIILTRDTQFAERPLASNNLFITSDRVKDQLHQVVETFNLEIGPSILTRCSVCNEPLIEITKQDAEDLVPDYVLEKKNSFLRCAKCRRIYWKGTHIERMGL